MVLSHAFDAMQPFSTTSTIIPLSYQTPELNPDPRTQGATDDSHMCATLTAPELHQGLQDA
jgi:hypothetical protein